MDLGRGFAWLDTGTHDSLLDASHYIQTLESRPGLRVACVEEVAVRMGFITPEECHRLGAALGKSGYGRYVMDVAASLRGRTVVAGAEDALTGSAPRPLPALAQQS